MPVSAPDTTGSSPSSSAGTERYTASSNSTMRALLCSDRRSASPLMVARAATANTPGPLIRRRRPADAPGCPSTAAAKARRTAASACSWPSVSEPAARVCANSSARLPSGDTQTPSAVRGPGVRSSCPMISSISPVGSRGSSDFISNPAGEDKSSSVAPMARPRPAAVKRSASTAALSR